MQGKTFCKKFSPAPLSKTLAQKDKDRFVSKFKKNKITICHSERREAQVPTEVELLRVERSEQAKARSEATKGYGNAFWWLYTAKVTFPLERHRNFKPYPAAATPCAFTSLFAR